MVNGLSPESNQTKTSTLQAERRPNKSKISHYGIPDLHFLINRMGAIVATPRGRGRFPSKILIDTLLSESLSVCLFVYLFASVFVFIYLFFFFLAFLMFPLSTYGFGNAIASPTTLLDQTSRGIKSRIHTL